MQQDAAGCSRMQQDAAGCSRMDRIQQNGQDAELTGFSRMDTYV